MFIKLLSGDLIEVDYETLKEVKQHLSDLTHTPRRYIKLLDPYTGDETESPKDPLACVYVSRDTDSDFRMEYGFDPQWSFDQVDHRTWPPDDAILPFELFEQVRFQCVRPTRDVVEFKEAIQGRHVLIRETLEDEVLTYHRLGSFMIDYLHPVFLLDYLPLLEPGHFFSNTVSHLLCHSFLDNHREEDEELVLQLCKRLIPTHNLPVSTKDCELAMYHGYDLVAQYLLSVTKSQKVKVNS